MYCKCGNVAEVFHRGDWVCKECRKAGLLPRYEKAKRVREQKCQEGIDRYWAGYWDRKGRHEKTNNDNTSSLAV